MRPVMSPCRAPCAIANRGCSRRVLQVVAGAEAPLPGRADDPGGYQVGLAERPEHGGEAAREEPNAHLIRGWSGDGQDDWRHQIPRVLRAYAEGPQERLRRGYPRGPLPAGAAQEGRQEMRDLVSVDFIRRLHLLSSARWRQTRPACRVTSVARRFSLSGTCVNRRSAVELLQAVVCQSDRHV